jgi:hypothetical protein
VTISKKTILIDGFEEYELPRSLIEGKGLHSFKNTQDVRQAVINMGYQLDKERWRRSRHSRTTVGTRQFKALSDHVGRFFNRLASDYIKSSHPPKKVVTKTKVPGSDEFRELVTYEEQGINWEEVSRRGKVALRQAYYDAYKIGLRSSGSKVVMSKADNDYVRSAFNHEMRYFNKMTRDVVAGSLRGNVGRRLEAYVEALKHVYYAGRIAGTPNGWAIDWIAPLDRATCNGCRFMSDHSPFTRSTLPTTPKAGDTRCLNRCRCKLVVRYVGPVKWNEIEKGHLAKSTYGKKLRRLKDGNALYTPRKILRRPER